MTETLNPNPEGTPPEPAAPATPPPAPPAPVVDANAARETADLRLANARLEAQIKFPGVAPELLAEITDPARVAPFAEKMHAQLAAQAPPPAPPVQPQVPAPVPPTGVGPPNAAPGSVDENRIAELTQKGFEGSITLAEAKELHDLGHTSMREQLREGAFKERLYA